MPAARHLAFGCLLLGFAAIALGQLNPRTAPLATNTLLLCQGVVACTIPISLVLAISLYRSTARGAGLLRAVLTMMLFFPLYLQAAGWNAGFGPQGWATARLDAPWLTGWGAAIWVHTAAAVPWATLIIGHGLRRLPRRETLEAAALECPPHRLLFEIVLPAAGVPVMTAALWVVVSVSSEMTVSDLFLIRTYAEELYVNFALGRTLRETLWMIAPSLLGLLTLAAAAGLLLERQGRIWEGAASPPETPAPNTALDLGKLAPTLLSLLLLLVLFATPVASLIWQAGLRDNQWTLTATIRQVGDAFQRFAPELRWSVVISGCAATVAILISLPLVAFASRGGWRAAPAVAVAAAGLATPAPLWALLILWLFNRPGLDLLHTRTIFSPVLAIAIRCLPVAIFILWHGLRTIPPAVYQSAQLDGASWWQTLRYVMTPMRWRHLTLAWVVSYAIAMADLSASILVVPPAVETAAVRLFGLLHAGVREQEAGLALATLLVCSGLAMAVWMLSQRLSND